MVLYKVIKVYNKFKISNLRCIIMYLHHTFKIIIMDLMFFFIIDDYTKYNNE